MPQKFLALTAVFDTISDMIIWIDGQRHIIYLNRSAQTMLNVPAPNSAAPVSIAAIFPGLADDGIWGEIVEQLNAAQSASHLPKTLEICDDEHTGACSKAQILLTKIGSKETPIYSLQIQGHPALHTITEEQYKNDQQYHEFVEQTLKNSREQMARAIEGSGVGLWEWSVNTQDVVINERWAEIIGYTAEELRPVKLDTWNQLSHPEDLARSYQTLEAHFRGEIPFYECEVRMRHKLGHWVWVLDRGRVTDRDNLGQPLRVTGTHLDISESRAMRDKLIYRSQFEDLLMQISTRFINRAKNEIDGEINHALQEIGEFAAVDRSYVFLLDPGQDTMTNTHEWCREGIDPQMDNLQSVPNDILPWWMAKMENQEAITITRLSELPPEAAVEKEMLEMQSILSIAVIPMSFQKHLLGFVGFDAVAAEKEWTADSVTLLRMFSNILSSALQRKHNESALSQSEARNAAMINAIPDMMFRIHKDGTFLDYALPNESELSIPIAKLIGSTVFHLFNPTIGAQAMESIQTAIRTGERQTFVYELPIPPIGMQHFEARIAANAEDEVIAIVRNISERIHLEEMKSDFINRAAHDLRTPLTTILMMVHLLEQECTPEESLEFWNIMKSELNREQTLIEDLLMVGRLESGRLEVKMRPIAPMDSLNASLQSLNAQAGAKDIVVSVLQDPDIPKINGDPSALQQVFTNLLNNAIKFTPAKGHITVSAQAYNHKVYFKIADTGMGIPPEDMRNLFSRFFRGRNAIDAEVSGSGIGLFIVKSIVERLGGQISVQSELTKGTGFEIELPELVPELAEG